jgi:pimeloyl-ACP methyl ester carboxylesterase
MEPTRRALIGGALGAIGAAQVFAQGRNGADLPKAPADVKPGSITYEDVAYPHPVEYLPLTLYGQDVKLAYMDVAPSGTPNGRSVILFHGMNFGGFYFSGLIDLLRKDGFRVVVPDQIGFGRSSKPIIPYNFHDMAANSRKLLQTLGITKTAIVGHSMGGMLTARFSATQGDIVERAVIYNPIGTTDGRFGNQKWRNAEEIYRVTVAQTHDQAYAQASGTIHRYFAQPGAWRPEFEDLVRILYAPTLSADWPRWAMVRTLVQQLPFLDPVVYDWPHIKVKTCVLGGDKDTPSFPAEAKHIADTIPGAELVLLPGLGHVPHVEKPEVFNPALMKFLKS